MAITPIKHVDPGDLITATFINNVIDALDTLQEQIDAIGSGPAPPGAPVIISVQPSQGVAAGAEMTIIGENFAVPAVVNTVKLDSTELIDFVSGTDTHIVVVVPGSIPGLPKTMTLSIATEHGSDERNVTVLPGVVKPTGKIKVTNTTGALGNITVGGTFTYNMKLDTGGMNIGEDFKIQAEYLNAVGASTQAWQAATSYLGIDSNGVAHVEPTAPLTVGVTFKVPTGATSVDLVVRAISVHNDPASSSASPVIPIAVGQPPLPTDASIVLTINTHQGTKIQNQTFSGATPGAGLGVKFGENPLVTLHAKIDHAGSYKFTAAIENSSESIWKLTGMPQTLGLGPGGAADVQFNLQLVPTTPPADPTSVRRYLVFTATREDAGGVGKISNYLRFPIGEHS